MNLGTGAAAGPAWSPLSSLSEAGTLALEWSMLDRMSGALWCLGTTAQSKHNTSKRTLLPVHSAGRVAVC